MSLDERQPYETMGQHVRRLLTDPLFWDADDNEIAELVGCGQGFVRHIRGLWLAWEHAVLLAQQIQWPSGPSALISVALEHYAQTLPGRRGVISPWEHPELRGRMVSDRKADATIGGRPRR